MTMDWISTPFLLVAFTSVVFFAISCAFCFWLGRLLGKLDGRDALGEGRRVGAPDRRGPHRTSAADRGDYRARLEGLEDEDSEPADPLVETPAFKHTSAG